MADLYPDPTPNPDPSPMPPERPGGHWGHRPEAAPEAAKFLQGPQRRAFEIGRAFRIFRELLRGFRRLHFVGPCVTVFGSARFPPGHPYYEASREVGRLLAERGFTVMTGGGPGVMEAANRGAKEAGGRSVGCNVVLPREQGHNDYLDLWIDFEHFFVRKLMLIKYSYAFIVMPGGFGTLDELFEVLTLVQTGKVQDFPVVLMGREYYQPGIDMFRQMLAARTIDAADLDKLLVTDDPAEAVNAVTETAMKRFNLTYGPKATPHWYYGERVGAWWRRRFGRPAAA